MFKPRVIIRIFSRVRASVFGVTCFVVFASFVLPQINKAVAGPEIASATADREAEWPYIPEKMVFPEQTGPAQFTEDKMKALVNQHLASLLQNEWAPAEWKALTPTDQDDIATKAARRLWTHGLCAAPLLLDARLTADRIEAVLNARGSLDAAAAARTPDQQKRLYTDYVEQFAKLKADEKTFVTSKRPLISLRQIEPVIQTALLSLLPAAAPDS